MIYGNMKEHKYMVDGVKSQLMTEATSLLHSCYEQGIFDKSDIAFIAENATKSLEDLVSEGKKSDCDAVSMLAQIIDDAGKGNEAAIDLLAELFKGVFK